jgi:hypothetical protein
MAFNVCTSQKQWLCFPLSSIASHQSGAEVALLQVYIYYVNNSVVDEVFVSGTAMFHFGIRRIFKFSSFRF